jgi:hypothetical protein
VAWLFIFNPEATFYETFVTGVLMLFAIIFLQKTLNLDNIYLLYQILIIWGG